MTTTHPHLEGLIRKWREEAVLIRAEANTSCNWSQGRARQLECCAYELESALSPTPTPHEADRNG